MAQEPAPLAAWKGAFGDAYTDRNAGGSLAVAQRIRALAQVLARTQGQPPQSFLEVGANVGLNLEALKALGYSDLWAVEPNDKARASLVERGVMPADRVIDGFGHKIPVPDASVDLAFTAGVLIHVAPALLRETLAEIVRVSRQYVFAWEYFAPRQEEIAYRGETGLMYRNDFGGLYLDHFKNLELIDYGFFWKRTTGLDDVTWWLFRKV